MKLRMNEEEEEEKRSLWFLKDYFFMNENIVEASLLKHVIL